MTASKPTAIELFPEGVQIRASGTAHAENEAVAMLTLEVWPVPAEITELLACRLRDETRKFLEARGITDDTVPPVELTAKGMVQ